MRRPAQYTFLTDYNISLKELQYMVNSPVLDSHISYCLLCSEGGELLCCDGCSAAYHTTCVGLVGVPEADWFCALCVQVGEGEGGEPVGRDGWRSRGPGKEGSGGGGGSRRRAGT